MRLQLSVLERARRDPAGFLAEITMSANTWYRFGFHQLLECCILRMHKDRLTADAARQLLESWFDRKFRNQRRLPELLAAFDAYVAQYKQLGNQTASTRLTVVVPLVAGSTSETTVSGRVSRVDLVPCGGYAAWLFVKQVADWRDELRMPLFQLAVADKLGAGLTEVSIGVYCFEDERHHALRYTSSDCDAAMGELARIVSQLRQMRPG